MDDHDSVETLENFVNRYPNQFIFLEHAFCGYLPRVPTHPEQ